MSDTPRTVGWAIGPDGQWHESLQIVGSVAKLLPLPTDREQFYAFAQKIGLTYEQAEQVRSYGESCARMAREEERERCARRCEEMLPPGWPDTCNTEAQRLCAAAIRKGEWGTSSIDDPAYKQEQREKNERMRNLVDSLARKD